MGMAEGTPGMGEVVGSVGSVKWKYSKEKEKEGINTHERSVGAAGLQLVKNKLKCFPIKIVSRYIKLSTRST